jgi:hypothetical protein
MGSGTDDGGCGFILVRGARAGFGRTVLIFGSDFSAILMCFGLVLRFCFASIFLVDAAFFSAGFLRTVFLARPGFSRVNVLGAMRGFAGMAFGFGSGKAGFRCAAKRGLASDSLGFGACDLRDGFRCARVRAVNRGSTSTIRGFGCAFNAGFCRAANRGLADALFGAAATRFGAFGFAAVIGLARTLCFGTALDGVMCVLVLCSAGFFLAFPSTTNRVAECSSSPAALSFA